MFSPDNDYSNKFKNYQGVRYTKGLFYEETLADKSSVVYTLKNEDYQGYPSLYRLYMECEDPTEVSFVEKYLDSWDHFEMLLACEWFQPKIERWRRELNLRLRAKALNNIREIAARPGKEQLNANKYLLNWLETPAGASKRGRPTKVAIEAEAKRLASSNRQIEDDHSRLLAA